MSIGEVWKIRLPRHKVWHRGARSANLKAEWNMSNGKAEGRPG